MSTPVSTITHIGFALYAMPPEAPRWGVGFKRAVKENFNRTLNIYAHTTTLHLDSNSISLLRKMEATPAGPNWWPLFNTILRNYPEEVDKPLESSIKARE